MNSSLMISYLSVSRILVLGVIALLNMVVLNSANATAPSVAEPQAATLHVRGEAQLMVEPDQVSVMMGVSTEAAKAKQAMAENSRKMTAIIQQLDRLGITDKEYKTQGFRVQAVWSSRPKNANSHWRSKIVGYRVNNNLQLTTQRINEIGEMIEAVSEAGANKINSVHFSLSNPREYRAQAITQAMQNAKEDAQTLVNASGDRIQRTLSLRLDNTEASRSRADVGMMRKQASFALQDAPAPPIDAGDITVRASVSVTYEIAPK